MALPAHMTLKMTEWITGAPGYTAYLMSAPPACPHPSCCAALQYKILHAAARITRGARRRQLKIQASWPWAKDIVTAFGHISALAGASGPASACPTPTTTPPGDLWTPPAPRPDSRVTVTTTP